MVLLYHAVSLGMMAPPRRLSFVFTQGFLGVPLFFVLSGFVLAYSHLEVSHWRRFYLARFARVYPLYLFALCITVFFAREPTAAMSPLQQRWAWPADLLLLQAWIPGWQWTGNPAAWTLSVEAFFYLVFPWILPWVVRQLRWRWVWIAAFWLLFAVPPLLAEHPQFARHMGLAAVARMTLQNGLFCPPSFLGEFVMGMFAGAQFRRHPRQFGMGSTIAAVSLAGFSLYGATVVGYFTARNSAVALAFLILVYTLAGWHSRVLASRPLQLAGEISYGMYLLQFWAFRVVYEGPHVLRHVPIVFCLLLGSAFLTYVLLEKPARTFLLRSAGVRPSPKPIPTSVPVP